LSFFDEGDEPARPARPRSQQSTGAAPPASRDHQTLMVRRGVAAGVILLVIILLVVGIRGCLNSQKKQSLKDYNRNVGALVQESDQVSQKLFGKLSATGGATNTATQGTATLNAEQDINQVRVDADDLVRRASSQNTPGDMSKAQRTFLLALTLRRDAIRKIAEKLQTARGASGADAAVDQIAGQMQSFLASDVVYSQRVIPYIKKALDGAGVTGQTIATSQSLPDLGWLDPTQVAKRIGAITSSANKGPAAPGSHGHQLESVTVGSTTLKQGQGNKVSGSSPVFAVKFVNQGENDESNVLVKITISGSGNPITVTKPVASSPAGAESSVEIPLGQAPPLNTPVTVTAEVQPVPGETDASNNKQSYQVLFSS
jgi:hypothetical protein